MAKVLDGISQTRQVPLIAQGVERSRCTARPGQRRLPRISRSSPSVQFLFRQQLEVEAEFFLEVGVAAARTKRSEKAAEPLAERGHGLAARRGSFSDARVGGAIGSSVSRATSVLGAALLDMPMES